MIRLGEASHHASPGLATHHDLQELRRISPDMEPVRPVHFLSTDTLSAHAISRSKNTANGL